MSLTTWWNAFMQSLKQTTPFEYRNDKKFVYLLIAIKDGEPGRYSKIFSTSSPLDNGHTLILAPNKIFFVTAMSHVIYPIGSVDRLTRPTTMVHVGIQPHPDCPINTDDLERLDFIYDTGAQLYTIH
jgi:hypothetical protein